MSDGNLLAGIRDGEWLSRQEFPPLRYAVPGIVPEGLTVPLARRRSASRGWCSTGSLAVAADDGVAVGGIPAPGARDVLYMALEDGDRRMQSRCHTLLANPYRPADPIPPRFQYLTTVTPNLLMATIAAWLEAYQSGLVVVDTLGRALPPAATGAAPYSRDDRIMSDLKVIADAWPGCSLLMNHHDRKAASPDFVDSVSGTNGIAGGADTVLALTRDRNEADGLLQVTGRDVSEGAYALTFGAGAWSWFSGGLDRGQGSCDQARRDGARRPVPGSPGQSVRRRRPAVTRGWLSRSRASTTTPQASICGGCRPWQRRQSRARSLSPSEVSERPNDDGEIRTDAGRISMG
jgi:hypothetical protein